MRLFRIDSPSLAAACAGRSTNIQRTGKSKLWSSAPRRNPLQGLASLKLPLRADSAPTAVASGTTAVRAIAAVPLRARRRLHRPRRAFSLRKARQLSA